MGSIQVHCIRPAQASFFGGSCLQMWPLTLLLHAALRVWDLPSTLVLAILKRANIICCFGLKVLIDLDHAQEYN
jgi:hypothetical protein